MNATSALSSIERSPWSTAESSLTKASAREYRRDQPAHGQAAPGPADDVDPDHADGGRDRGQPHRVQCGPLCLDGDRPGDRAGLPEHEPGLGDNSIRPG